LLAQVTYEGLVSKSGNALNPELQVACDEYTFVKVVACTMRASILCHVLDPH
jgi:hypothetical protein